MVWVGPRADLVFDSAVRRMGRAGAAMAEWIPVLSHPEISIDDTLDGDYRRLLERATDGLSRKGVASPTGVATPAASWPRAAACGVVAAASQRHSTVVTTRIFEESRSPNGRRRELSVLP